MSCQKYTFEPGESSAAFSSSPRLLYVSASNDEEDWPSFMHSHHFTELFYVRSGSGNFLIDDNSFPVVKDDLIIVNPHLSHTEVSAKTNPLSYITLGIEGLGFSFRDGMDFSIFNCSRDEGQLPFYFYSILSELEKKRDGYQEICSSMIQILTTQLYRITGAGFNGANSERTNHDLFRIKRYIDSHYQDSLTLEQLSQISHINKYYLVHKFAQSFGCSPISYLNERRIQASRDLLESTDHSIAEIARLTGFSSQCYFAQSFKKNCGLTAREYRKQVRGKREAPADGYETLNKSHR